MNNNNFDDFDLPGDWHPHQDVEPELGIFDSIPIARTMDRSTLSDKPDKYDKALMYKVKKAKKEASKRGQKKPADLPINQYAKQMQNLNSKRDKLEKQRARLEIKHGADSEEVEEIQKEINIVRDHHDDIQVKYNQLYKKTFPNKILE